MLLLQARRCTCRSAPRGAPLARTKARRLEPQQRWARSERAAKERAARPPYFSLITVWGLTACMYAPALAALGSEKSTLASGSEESATAPWKLIQRPEPSTEPTVLAAKERLRSLLSSEAEHLPLLQRLEEAAEATAAMLDTLDGDMRLLVSTLGGEYTGPHLDAERMCKFFHRDGFSAEKIAAMYVCSTTGFVPPIKDRDETVDAQRLRAATAPQLPEHQAWAEKALLKDAAMGHALLIPLREQQRLVPGAAISPWYLVPKGENEFRRIHNATATCNVFDSPNSVTDMDAMHPVQFMGAFDRILKRVYHMALANPESPVMLMVIDVKAAFRQLPIDPAYAPYFCYIVGSTLAIELRGCFGWRGTPAEFDLWPQAFQHRMRHSGFCTATSKAAQDFVREHIKILRPPAGTVLVHPKSDPLATGPPASYYNSFDGNWWVDDGTFVEQGTNQYLNKVAEVAVDCHFAAFAEPCDLRPNPVSISKLKETGGWATRHKVLGIMVDTVLMQISLPDDKKAKLTSLLFEQWDERRKFCTVRELQELIGNLRYLALVVRPGRYFLWVLQGALRRAGTLPSSRVQLTAGFHADLSWWRWLVTKVEHTTVPLSMPLFLHVQQPAAFEIHSDASKWGAGGCSAAHRICWRFQWPADIVQRFNNGTSSAVYINELELAGMIVNAWAVLVYARKAVRGSSVSVRGDNSSAVHWMNAAGTSSEGPAGALMRILGALEIECEMSFRAAHIAGVDNVLADALSRANVRPAAHLPPASPVPAGWWQVCIPPAVLSTTLEVLRGSCGSQAWLAARDGSTRLAGAPGWPSAS